MRLKKFNYNDLSCLVVASVNGRNESMFGKKLSAAPKDDDSEVVCLIADPTDQIAVKKLHVRLVDDGNALILTRQAGAGPVAAPNYPDDTAGRYKSIPLVEGHHTAAESLKHLLPLLG